ncbi:hypothetical protein SAMN05444487_1069 [Marininema mesophilum]|uniref:Uncharacterized protein n=1 Tax=Marininema mesophilum TaxID=1048340 RepID=A0A1H2W585_9BACL|nr:hypothetical protein [Marininema mesophilum]SDW75249.1 hypothetical protein SAMN05444487_1069 [Marininema mesophilum]
MSTTTKDSVRVQLSPPQFTYLSKLKFTVGRDPNVQVGDLKSVDGNTLRITIRVNGRQRARALATILTANKSIGNIIIQVRIVNQGTTVCPIRRSLSPSAISDLYKVGLSTNDLFLFSVARGIVPGGSVAIFPVFRARIVQFFNDDLSDLFRNFNGVAAFVFRDVCRNRIQGSIINFSTQQKNPPTS